MQMLKQLSTCFSLGLLFSITSQSNIKADHQSHHHEKVFANSATKHELVDAYLSKCAENHYLAQNLDEARKHNYSWKDIKKSFGVGVVAGLAVSAIVYIVTR